MSPGELLGVWEKHTRQEVKCCVECESRKNSLIFPVSYTTYTKENILRKNNDRCNLLWLG